MTGGPTFYRSNSCVILSETRQAASSTLFAALAANRRVGLFLGIIMIATAPTAAPTPIVIAKPFAFIFIPPFGISMPPGKKFTCGKIFALFLWKKL